MTIQQLNTDRLILRDVTLADVDAYQRHFADYEVIRHLAAAVPWPYPADGAKYFIENVILPAQGHDRWVWAIFLRTNPDEMIGVIDLWREGRPEHRGFWLARTYQGHGYMSEAARAVTDYAFTSLGFEKLIFSNALGNVPSRRVKEKTGARFLKTEPCKFVDPAYTERELWELTKSDWAILRS